jgi:DNA-binding NtrC family response regulator
LIDHFLSRLNNGRQEHRTLPVAVREAMENYSWPGNVRELQSTLHTYITLGRLDLMGQVSMTVNVENNHVQTPLRTGAGLRERIENLEKKIIIDALDAARWHRGKAAEALQITTKTLQRKIKSLGIK